MVKYEVTNTSNIRKFVYGTQVEPGETKEIDVLVKEAEEIPGDSFAVERVEEPGSSQAEESAEESNDEPTDESTQDDELSDGVEAESEASLDKNPEENSGGE